MNPGVFWLVAYAGLLLYGAKVLATLEAADDTDEAAKVRRLIRIGTKPCRRGCGKDIFLAFTSKGQIALELTPVTNQFPRYSLEPIGSGLHAHLIEVHSSSPGFARHSKSCDGSSSRRARRGGRR